MKSSVIARARSRRVRALGSALATLALGALPAHAQTWDGGGADTNWSTAANWENDTLPTFGSFPNITLTGTSNYSSHVDQAVTLSSLTFIPTGVVVNYVAQGHATLTGETITFRAGASGAAILLAVGGSTNTGQGNATIDNNLKFLGTGSIRATQRNLTLNGNLDLNGASEIQFNTNNNLSMTINGAISGTLNHVRFTGHALGTSRTYLNSVNTYAATTTIWTGGVVIGADGQQGVGDVFGSNNSTLLLGANATGAYRPSLLTGAAVNMKRDMRIITNTVGTLETVIGGSTAHTSTFSGNITMGTAGQAGEDLAVTAVAGGRVNFTGNLLRADNATGATDTVAKTGVGIVALSGSNNTYLGATTVEAGKLVINGVLSSGGAAVTVNSGATLGGAGGQIARDVNLLSGSVLEVGDNHAGVAGQLAITGALSLADNVTVKFDLGATQALSDTLSVTGAVTLGNTVTFDLTALSGFGGATSYTLLSATGGFLGDANTIAFTGYDFGDAYHLVIDGTSISLVSSAIPEPSSIALLAGGFTLAGVLVRRRPRSV